jgi:hypothetical protein
MSAVGNMSIASNFSGGGHDDALSFQNANEFANDAFD